MYFIGGLFVPFNGQIKPNHRARVRDEARHRFSGWYDPANNTSFMFDKFGLSALSKFCITEDALSFTKTYPSGILVGSPAVFKLKKKASGCFEGTYESVSGLNGFVRCVISEVAWPAEFNTNDIVIE